MEKKALGAALKAARDRLHITQAEALLLLRSKGFDVSLVTIQHYEGGRIGDKAIHRLEAMIEALNSHTGDYASLVASNVGDEALLRATFEEVRRLREELKSLVDRIEAINQVRKNSCL